MGLVSLKNCSVLCLYCTVFTRNKIEIKLILFIWAMADHLAGLQDDR